MRKHCPLPKPIQFRLSLCMLCLSLLIGCQTARYYSQAISGQLTILGNRESIEKVLRDPKTPADLREKLELVLDLRRFAESELHLPVNNNYRSFVRLSRSYALWNVYAAPEFSLSPKTWCYPIVGCAAYRGFFAEQDARDYAAKLQRKGYDTFVGGVAAYSTLGWFDDPVLSTFVNRSDTRLAALIFHELAHQVLYAEGDTVFNESFATAVEQEGLHRWLASENDLESFASYEVDNHRRRQFVQLVLKYRKQLQSLYAKDMPLAEKREAKARAFEGLEGEYKLLKQQWEGHSAYDAWFDRGLNNAKIITVSTYHDLVPAFLGLLRANGNDLEVFYEKCRDLLGKSKEERRSYLGQFQTQELPSEADRP